MASDSRHRPMGVNPQLRPQTHAHRDDALPYQVGDLRRQSLENRYTPESGLRGAVACSTYVQGTTLNKFCKVLIPTHRYAGSAGVDVAQDVVVYTNRTCDRVGAQHRIRKSATDISKNECLENWVVG